MIINTWESEIVSCLVSLTLCNPIVCPWNFLSKNTEVGCHSLLQMIFLTQVLNQGLLHCRLIFFFFFIWTVREAQQIYSEVAQSCPTLCDPWTIAHQAPLSMGFSRQEYWSGLPLPSPGDLPDPGIEPRSPTLQADALTSALPGKPLNTRIQSLRKPPIETKNFRSKY